MQGHFDIAEVEFERIQGGLLYFREETEGEEAKSSLVILSHYVTLSEREKPYSLPYPLQATGDYGKGRTLPQESETAFMRVVVQRVSEASVSVLEGGEERLLSEIGHGFLLLVGVKNDDTEADAVAMAEKVANLRVFEDENGKLNLSLLETEGSAIVVSNFTLYGDCRKGRRPGFTEAASGEVAESLYRTFGEKLRGFGVPVSYGAFGCEMRVSLINAGPITLLLDSRKGF